MKAEINSQNKAKFFALYWGQKIGFVKNDMNGWEVGKCNFIDSLELKPLSKISNDDAIEVAIMFNRYRLGSNRYENQWKVRKNEYGNVKVKLSNDHYNLEVMISLTGSIWSNDDSLTCNYKIIPIQFDYLRSRGYALPWMGLSVEEMCEAGWIKLTDS